MSFKDFLFAGLALSSTNKEQPKIAEPESIVITEELTRPKEVITSNLNYTLENSIETDTFSIDNFSHLLFSLVKGGALEGKDYHFSNEEYLHNTEGVEIHTMQELVSLWNERSKNDDLKKDEDVLASFEFLKKLKDSNIQLSYRCSYEILSRVGFGSAMILRNDLDHFSELNEDYQNLGNKLLGQGFTLTEIGDIDAKKAFDVGFIDFITNNKTIQESNFKRIWFPERDMNSLELYYKAYKLCEKHSLPKWTIEYLVNKDTKEVENTYPISHDHYSDYVTFEKNPTFDYFKKVLEFMPLELQNEKATIKGETIDRISSTLYIKGVDISKVSENLVETIYAEIEATRVLEQSKGSNLLDDIINEKTHIIMATDNPKEEGIVILGEKDVREIEEQKPASVTVLTGDNEYTSVQKDSITTQLVNSIKNNKGELFIRIDGHGFANGDVLSCFQLKPETLFEALKERNSSEPVSVFSNTCYGGLFGTELSRLINSYNKTTSNNKIIITYIITPTEIEVRETGEEGTTAIDSAARLDYKELFNFGGVDHKGNNVYIFEQGEDGQLIRTR